MTAYPQDLLGIVALIIATTGTIAAAWIGRKVQDQVKNSHKTNLRDDLDKVINAVTAMTGKLEEMHGEQREQRSEIGELREKVGYLHGRVT